MTESIKEISAPELAKKIESGAELTKVEELATNAVGELRTLQLPGKYSRTEIDRQTKKAAEAGFDTLAEYVRERLGEPQVKRGAKKGNTNAKRK